MLYRSIFEGASKYEILHYLRDAKDRIGASSSCSGEIDDDEQSGSRVQTPAAVIPGEGANLLRRNQGGNSIGDLGPKNSPNISPKTGQKCHLE